MDLVTQKAFGTRGRKEMQTELSKEALQAAITALENWPEGRSLQDNYWSDGRSQNKGIDHTVPRRGIKRG